MDQPVDVAHWSDRAQTPDHDGKRKNPKRKRKAGIIRKFSLPETWSRKGGEKKSKR
jgi:hypothetical protein